MDPPAASWSNLYFECLHVAHMIYPAEFSFILLSYIVSCLQIVGDDELWADEHVITLQLKLDLNLPDQSVECITNLAKTLIDVTIYLWNA